MGWKMSEVDAGVILERYLRGREFWVVVCWGWVLKVELV